MKSFISAVIAGSLIAAPAQAINVSYTPTSIETFARSVSQMYDGTPAQLRARVGNPTVFAVNLETLRKMPLVDKAAFRDDVRFYGQANRILGKSVSRLVFVEKSMSALSAEHQYRVVLHEMMHLYDFEVNPEKSKAKAFVAAFQKDKAKVTAYLKGNDVSEDDRRIVLAYAHYLEAPKEAFAEAGARLISPPTNQNARENFFAIFANVTAYVEAQLRKDGIVTNAPASKPVEAKAPAAPQQSWIDGPLGGSCPQGTHLDPFASGICVKDRVWPSQLLKQEE
jgi:hypothetical protein